MIIKVKVFPKSNFNKILKINNNEYSIYVKEDTKNNKANRRMINLLSKELNISFTKLKIKNMRSREKIIEIIDC